MQILVVCGAGASSTFVAQRLRAAAQAAGIELETRAVSRETLPARLADADALLIGPHLPDRDAVQTDAARLGIPALALPADVFTDRDGTRVLALVTPLLEKRTAS